VLKKRPSGDFDYPEPQRVGNSHVWLFDGAEGGKWVEDIAKETEATPEDGSGSSSESGDASSDWEANARRKPKKARTQ